MVIGSQLSTLLKQSSINDHEVLQTCNSLLKQSINDLETQHVKVIALLKLERYEDALRVLDGGDNSGLKTRAQVERAYALYKLGEFEQARDIAKSVSHNRGARHVEAQASYRLEKFSEAATIYRGLANGETALANEEGDLKINSGATDAQLEWQGNGHLIPNKRVEREDLESFEAVFNAACGAVARGEYHQGETLLKRAQDLCCSLDELSDQEKQSESLPIAVQQLYTLIMLGRIEEAEKVSSDIVLQDISDPSIQQIAQNNKIAAAPRMSNPFLSRRFFDNIPTLPKTDQLFHFQTDRIQQNSLVLDLHTLKFAGVSRSTAKLLSNQAPTNSAHINNISILNAAAQAQNQLGKLGLRKILPLLEKRPYDIGLILTIVQLYVLTNNMGSAITVLESFFNRLASTKDREINQDVLFAPGLTATLVSLYTSQNRKSQIKTVLAKAASYWRHKSKPPTALLEAAGLELLDSEDIDHQALTTDIFSTLYSANPSSRVAKAGYVAAHTQGSRSSPPPKESESLSPVARLITGIDVATLEAAGVPPSSSNNSLTTRKRTLGSVDSKVKRKRIRTNRLPKDYEEGKIPDPERWLPLRDRSSYRPKGKKGRAKAAALTQGGLGGEKGNKVGEGGKGGGEGVIKATSVVGVAGSKGKKKKGKK